MDLRTDKERQKDKDHEAIRNLYKQLEKINEAEGRNYKKTRIYNAVAVITISKGMRGGRGYTSQSVRNIIEKTTKP